ncbi:MAG: hypothetical protein GX556_19170 [Fibrobacter sp.]|nr:hypothetical protein [Fibrobacter sp.]
MKRHLSVQIALSVFIPALFHNWSLDDPASRLKSRLHTYRYLWVIRIW